MKIHVLRCTSCDEQMSDATWRGIFGDRVGIQYEDGLEPHYECGCDGRHPRVYFSLSLTKEQLEAARADVGAFRVGLL